MKKWLMLSCLAVALLAIPKPAHAGPQVWTFTCDYWSAYPAGIITGNSGTFVQLRAYCWYEANYMGNTISEGSDWYTIMAPFVFYQKHGTVASVETYQGDAEPL